jgi:hypothetical protein
LIWIILPYIFFYFLGCNSFLRYLVVTLLITFW